MKLETKQLPEKPDLSAPDGSDVRLLLSLEGGSMAHFALAPEKTSKAVMHRTVEEIWYCVDGSGEMWRKSDEDESIVPVSVGTCLTIPVGTHFQFRSQDKGLAAVAITMPPWPGDDEAVLVEGPWSG